MALLWARMTPQQKPARTCSSRTWPRRPAAASTLQRFLWPACVTTVRDVQATEKNSWGAGGSSHRGAELYLCICMHDQAWETEAQHQRKRLPGE